MEFKDYDAYIICNPLVDLQVKVEDEFVDSIGRVKGGMFLIDEQECNEIITSLRDKNVLISPGGSGANTAQAMAVLGGKPTYCGKLARDRYGAIYADELRSAGVHYSTEPGDGKTGMCVVLITPDAERTMNTYLGASITLDEQDINPDEICNSKCLYITGYMWDTENQKAAVMKALDVARDKGIQTSFSLSDSFFVARNKEAFLKLIKEHVDILFANEHELLRLVGEQDVNAAAEKIDDLVNLTAITMGKEGALIRYQNRNYHIEATNDVAIDTTGAGDAFAAGLLFGLAQGYDIPKAGRVGSWTAGKVVNRIGPRFFPEMLNGMVEWVYMIKTD